MITRFLRFTNIFKYWSRKPKLMDVVNTQAKSKDIMVQDTTSESSIYITEGKAKIPFSKIKAVFYNPVQEFNRDMSVAVIRRFIQVYKDEASRYPNMQPKFKSLIDGKLTLLEALSATGLRSVRYALEIPGLDSIVANDLLEQAVQAIEHNVKLNGVEHLVSTSRSDASILMYQCREFKKRFTIVDLDPYGSPAQFLDPAVQSTADGGLLLVTCTDMAILCGNAAETCRAKYGATSLKMKCCHEMALRIVLQSIESHANRYGRFIVPLLSLSVDFYIRVFVRIYTSPSKVKESSSKLAMVYHCTGCHMFHLQPLGMTDRVGPKVVYSTAHGPPVSSHCKHCGSRFHVGGPIWTGPLHDKNFVASTLEQVQNTGHYGTQSRMEGILTMVQEELDDVLYYDLGFMASLLHAVTPKLLSFKSALLHAGYHVSDTHIGPNKVKTNAPPEVLWDIFRAWVTETPVKRELVDNSPAKAILGQPQTINVNFELHPDAQPNSRKNKLLRYQQNPAPHWGPGCRPRDLSSKRKQEEEIEVEPPDEHKIPKLDSPPDEARELKQ